MYFFGSTEEQLHWIKWPFNLIASFIHINDPLGKLTLSDSLCKELQDDAQSSRAEKIRKKAN